MKGSCFFAERSPHLGKLLTLSLQYEAVREERRQAELQAAAQAAGKAPLSPLFVVRRRRFSCSASAHLGLAVADVSPCLYQGCLPTQMQCSDLQAPAKKPTAAQRIGLVPQ